MAGSANREKHEGQMEEVFRLIGKTLPFHGRFTFKVTMPRLYSTFGFQICGEHEVANFGNKVFNRGTCIEGVKKAGD